MKRVSLLLAIVANTAFGSSFTIGPNGIDSKSTGLDGSTFFTFAVGLGMADDYRSAKAGYDDDEFSAPNTIPYGVYYQSTGSMAVKNDWISPDDHATEVAGVMIGKAQPDGKYEGVAPGARLHSVGISDWFDDGLSAVALNNLARLNVTPRIIATNLSWGVPTSFVEDDGRSHLTQFIDWSARRQDVLYVVAAPNSIDQTPSVTVHTLG